MATFNSRRAQTWRETHGLSQVEAARILGVDANTWWRWEHAQRDVPPTALRLMLALEHLWRYEPDALKG